MSRLPVRSLSLTTNGFLLKSLARPLAEAGLRRINVSLDTLQHDRFHQIARRRGLDEVLAGLEELERYPSISQNAVGCFASSAFRAASRAMPQLRLRDRSTRAASSAIRCPTPNARRSIILG